MLTVDEIDLAKEMLSVLRLMEVATRELCGQKYVTGSKEAMLENLDTRFGRMEEISLLSVATILDPRFKTIHLNNPYCSARAIRLIKNKITEVRNSCDDSNSSSCHDSSDDDERLFSKAGNIRTEKRNRLKGEKLQQLLFLSSLDFNDWHLE
ncbi:unnamed protein product [Macrosiphum euphorbiae]|uniref:Uncharacterized protein n=1 Tax=Macrosiphum euphorbiae TaxID=13131 RepID=A0AAV0WAT7_9HEMI|nr:unnamed protein product [Macrosiphum euphorbiae]